MEAEAGGTSAPAETIIFIAWSGLMSRYVTFSCGTTRRKPVVGLTALGTNRLQSFLPVLTLASPWSVDVTNPRPHVPGDGNSTIATRPNEAIREGPSSSSAI